MADIPIGTEDEVWVDDQTLAEIDLAEEQYQRGEVLTLAQARANLQTRRDLEFESSPSLNELG